MPEFDSTIRFAPIPDYPGYIAGSDGTIWSIKTRGWNDMTPLKMNPNKNLQGYFKLALRNKGTSKQVTRSVHALVLSAFVGPKPKGMEARHLNGVRTDNRIDNLVWGTHKENCADQLEHGTRRHKLITEDVSLIKVMISNGVSFRRIGRIFGVAHSTICLIASNTTWKHVT